MSYAEQKFLLGSNKIPSVPSICAYIYHDVHSDVLTRIYIYICIIIQCYKHKLISDYVYIMHENVYATMFSHI